MKRTSWVRYDGGGVTLRLRTQSLILSRGAMWVSRVFESWGYKMLRKAPIYVHRSLSAWEGVRAFESDSAYVVGNDLVRALLCVKAARLVRYI